ncbi:MAG TPA: acetylxylan esterase [Candidatus Polarisedimenticolaceae bacterium]|nr:acetylxylan esterase [Candidatus Polarisedimenticolaceae bacterium]
MLDRLRRSGLGDAARRWLPPPLRAVLHRLRGALEASSDPFRTCEIALGRNLREESARSVDRWRTTGGVDDWRRLRDSFLTELGGSLGPWRPDERPLHSQTTGRVEGDGFRVDCLVFTARPDVRITANLYRPAECDSPRPGIVFCHGHHAGKCQPELWEAGVEWARAGCVVLIPDLAGHGERREHPFASPADHPGPFRPDRQDYWFRYSLGLQLAAVGHSLLGWMVHDTLRSVDLLVARNDVDPARIAVVGSVAGGGDVAAVAAALDPRIDVVVPFNFGGAMDDPGAGGWDASRSPRRRASHGLAPWMILASVAPRRLVYAHEFGWEAATDPVWERLRRTWRIFDAESRLAVVHGRGRISGRPPHHTHCTSVGRIHRERLAPTLARWLGVACPQPGAPPMPHDRLHCLRDGDVKDGLVPIHRTVERSVIDRLTESRAARHRLAPADGRIAVALALSARLGPLDEPTAARFARVSRVGAAARGVERHELRRPGGARVRFDLRLPRDASSAPFPLVVGLGQAPAHRLARRRRALIERLCGRGIAVALAQTRGSGPTRYDDAGYGRTSRATVVSASAWMLDRMWIAARLSDVAEVMRALAERPEIDARRVAVWGEGDAPPNADGSATSGPIGVEPEPVVASPVGGIVALAWAVGHGSVRAVYVHRGLVSLASILESPRVCLPHEAVIPGLLESLDLPDLAAALAPLPIRLEALVDGRNRPVDGDRLERAYACARQRYRDLGEDDRLVLRPLDAADERVADWLGEALV